MSSSHRHALARDYRAAHLACERLGSRRLRRPKHVRAACVAPDSGSGYVEEGVHSGMVPLLVGFGGIGGMDNSGGIVQPPMPP